MQIKFLKSSAPLEFKLCILLRVEFLLCIDIFIDFQTHNCAIFYFLNIFLDFQISINLKNLKASTDELNKYDTEPPCR